MCVILHRIANTPVDEGDLRAAFLTNSDGCGLMYIRDGKLVTEKGLWTVDQMVAKVRALGDIEYCLHLRIKTHGKVDDNNCHPFPIGKNTAMMHNGTLQVKTPDSSFSDTWHFAKFLEECDVDTDVHAEPQLKEISDFHGTWNRMVFMSPSGVSRTGGWSQHGGNWWSNLNWNRGVKCSGEIILSSTDDTKKNISVDKVDDEDTVVVIDKNDTGLEDESSRVLQSITVGDKELVLMEVKYTTAVGSTGTEWCAGFLKDDIVVDNFGLEVLAWDQYDWALDDFNRYADKMKKEMGTEVARDPFQKPYYCSYCGQKLSQAVLGDVVECDFCKQEQRIGESRDEISALDYDPTEYLD